MSSEGWYQVITRIGRVTQINIRYSALKTLRRDFNSFRVLR